MLSKIFNKSALWLGRVIVSVLLLGVIALSARFFYVAYSDPVIDAGHQRAKHEYLTALPQVTDNAPNIIVIFFDDLGWGDLSIYGNRLIETPSIDQVAQEGLLMTNFYSASPVCTPSRAALLTGRLPPRTRTDRHVYFPADSTMGVVRKMLGWANELPKEEITLAEVMKHAGYRTGMIGKWHLGDHEGYRPNDFGFESFFGLHFSNDQYPLHLFRNEEVLIEDQREGGFFASERDELHPLPGQGVDQRQLTATYTQEAIEFVESAKGDPFFLYLAHSFPHVPHYPSNEFANTSRGGTYGDVIEDLDRSTGALMRALDRLGLSENTIVLITSDNGAAYNGSPGNLRGRKGQTLEGGQRVPMIVRWPGQVEPGRVTDAMAMNIDIFPTLLETAGLALPGDRVIDGRDISGLLQGKESSPHEFLYYFPVIQTLPDAIRNGDFKLSEKAGDFGRSRMHLSRLDDDAEAHDVQNLFAEDAASLMQALRVKQDEISDNPRGWIPHRESTDDL
jgi:arylsulfatase A-like enzyme